MVHSPTLPKPCFVVSSVQGLPRKPRRHPPVSFFANDELLQSWGPYQGHWSQYESDLPPLKCQAYISYHHDIPMLYSRSCSDFPMQFGKRNQDEVVQNDFPMQFGKQNQDEVNAHEFGGKTKIAKRKMDFWPHTPKGNKRKRMGSADFKNSGIQWDDIEGSIIHLC